MSVFKCKMCGGTIEFEPGATVGVCDSCGTKQTLPKTNDDAIANLFNRANNLRLKCEFDKAAAIYEKILDQDDSEAEAHWGIVLCKYGIEYVDDPATGNKIPTCHRTLFEAVTADADYQAAIDFSDPAQQNIYETEARTIDRIQKDILSIVKNEKPFDVFICYKETDENGKRTQDSAIANDIYYQLTQEGFKVFYAAITLEDKLGQEYEPYIFAALNSAKVMLVVGTNPIYFNSVWVRNEWSRYLKLMKTDRSKLLIPCYRDMDAYELPEEFAHMQAQDMSKIGFINDIVRGIRKVIVKEEPKANAASLGTQKSSVHGDISPLLKRIELFLDDGNWTEADEYCEKVLDLDPVCAEAYLGKLMAELHVKKQEDLAGCEEPFDNRGNYQKVLRFADSELSDILKGYITQINERKENERLTFIYNNAKEEMDSAQTEAEYREAASHFKGLSGFKDAEAMSEQCLDKAGECRRRYDELKAKEEADRQEAARKAEERRIAAEKAAKKRKKIIAITTPVVCALIAFVILLSSMIMYNKAVSLMNDGKYGEAIEKFSKCSYYKDSADMIEKCYIEILGEDKYNRIKNIKVGDTFNFGSYEQNNNISDGKEEIEWIVLERDGMSLLLISKPALDCQSYNTSYTSDVTWETCSLRKWLNGTFINNAFSTEEQKLIQSVTVTADKNPNFNTFPGNDTTDKVFLLSITEAEKYFSSNKARNCGRTKYADAQLGAGDTCWWWLRSPGGYSGYAALVYSDGSVYNVGYIVNYEGAFVRPAMWLNLG